MMRAPNPLLVTKMTRIALQILSTAEPRSKVTSPAAELVLETISSASPKVRRELLDAHLEALEWILADAFKAQAPTATFSMETVPQDLAGVSDETPALPEGVTVMSIARLAAHLLAQNKAWQKLAQMQQGELSSAWDNGYLAGASDRGAGPSNPYTLDGSDLTP